MLLKYLEPEGERQALYSLWEVDAKLEVTHINGDKLGNDPVPVKELLKKNVRTKMTKEKIFSRAS